MLSWHENSICIFPNANYIPFSCCFVSSNKKNSQTSSHKVHYLWSMKPVLYKQLSRNWGPASWGLLYCKADCTQRCYLSEFGQPALANILTMLMSILSYTLEQVYLCLYSRKLFQTGWFFWQKNYLFTFGICVS